LAIQELLLLLEDSLWRIGIIHVGVIHVLLSNDTESIFSNPSPESNCFIDNNLVDFRLSRQIEDLNNSLLTLCCSQGDNILASMHKNALCLHGLPLQSEVFRRVDDGTISSILDTDVLLRLESHLTEFEELRAKSKIGELEHLFEIEW
jgi:hypothetical protein